MQYCTCRERASEAAAAASTTGASSSDFSKSAPNGSELSRFRNASEFS